MRFRSVTVLFVVPLLTFPIASLVSAQRVNEAAAPPGIPAISTSSPPLGIVYDYVEVTERSEKDQNAVIDQKKRQYEEAVKGGTMSRDQADKMIGLIKATPLRKKRTGSITFVFDRGRMIVLGQTSDGIKAWTRIEDGVAVSRPWSGGDAWNLESRAEPYSLSNTLVPVLPLQLPTVRSFADLKIDGLQGQARVFAVSTISDQYRSGNLRFDHGRLSEVEIPNLEKTHYSDYIEGAVPLPRHIVLERLYGRDGKAQVVRTYSGRLMKKPVVPTLKELAPVYGTAVIDERVEPRRQFTYRPQAGSFLKQAESAQSIPSFDEIPDAPRRLIPTSVWLLGGSLLLLVVVATIKIILGRQKRKG